MDVTIYEDVNFGGRSETLEVGEHRLVSAADSMTASIPMAGTVHWSG
jgi:hypothetical protein